MLDPRLGGKIGALGTVEATIEAGVVCTCNSAYRVKTSCDDSLMVLGCFACAKLLHAMLIKSVS